MSPEQTIAHYRVTAKLGEGGMGTVYRATDTKLHRDVAIKVLPDSFAQDPDRMARFERESHVLASLNHPNIAAIHGVEERAIVMELVEGDTLHGPMEFEEALPVIHQLIDALEYAHEKGVVHRDLKPANIKVTPEWRVKVLDFGLAKAMSGDTMAGEPASSPTLTMRGTVAGMIMGTAAYMAPEQARGQSVDKRADIWAFGVVVHELVTGRRLFEGASISDTLAAVLKETPDCESVPAGLRKLLRLCLEKDPRKRLRDIGDARVLIEAEAALPALQPRRVAALWPALAAAGLLAFAVLAFFHFREAPPETSVVRFQVPLPEKTQFNGHVTVSPDGKRIAYAASGETGRSLIWIRELDKAEPRALAGTENGGHFFWSPDSRSLAFYADEKLKRVDVNAGSLQTICDTVNALNGAWNSEGWIVFGTTAGGLSRVPASGGTPVEVSHPDPRTETNHSHPVFLPDGRHILYAAEGLRAGEGAIYVAGFRPNAELERAKKIILSQTGPRYVPGPKGIGHILFIRGETLLEQSFDERTLQTVGDANPLIEQVGSFLARPFFGVSSNGVLAYWSGGNVPRSLIWFDRKGNQVAPPLKGDFYELSLSGDGERAAVGQRRRITDQEIAVVDLSRGTSMRIASDPVGLGSAIWSPDGKRLAFSSGGFREIHVKLSSGVGDEEKLAGLPPGISIPTDWSQDGKLILFEGQSAAPRSNLWIFPIGGDRKPYLYLNNAMNGRFSPDSRFVAYVSNETGRSEVYVQEFPPSGGKWQVSTEGGSQPRWNGDGKEIFFTDTDQNVMAVSVTIKPEFHVSSPRRLFYGNMFRAIRPGFYRYDVSRDGQRFLLNAYQSMSTGQLNVVLNWKSGK